MLGTTECLTSNDQILGIHSISQENMKILLIKKSLQYIISFVSRKSISDYTPVSNLVASDLFTKPIIRW